MIMAMQNPGPKQYSGPQQAAGVRPNPSPRPQQAPRANLNPMQRPQRAGEKMVSCLTAHPPGIKPGTRASVVSSQNGVLYAAQLPDGEIYRWFAGSELQSSAPRQGNSFQPGDYARVLSGEGHPAKIKKGMAVRIVKAINQTPYYDVKLQDGTYHRWLADFEVT